MLILILRTWYTVLSNLRKWTSAVHTLSLGTWIWLISDLKPYLLLHRYRTFTGPALSRHQTQRNVFVKLKQIFLDWNRNLTFRLLIRSFIWYLICLTNINRKQTILFFKTMDVCQLKHLSKMNLCGDTLFQEWKTEKTDLYTPCRTLFMGIDLQRSGKQTCSDKTDLSASTEMIKNTGCVSVWNSWHSLLISWDLPFASRPLLQPHYCNIDPSSKISIDD